MKNMKFFWKAFRLGFRLPELQEEQQYFPNTKCVILDGKRLSNMFVQQAYDLKSHFKNVPHISIILVGHNSASQVYVKNKIKIFKKVGFLVNFIHLEDQSVSNDLLYQKIDELNNDSSIHGILVQLPLPKHLDAESILSRVSVKKDVDGFSAENIGLLALNSKDAHMACTPFGIMMLLKSYGILIEGKNCVVLGRSRIVGKPMGLLLLNANATVTYVHSYTKNIEIFTKNADILIVAVGKKHFLQKEHIKKGAVVIDVGIHKNEDGSLSGDVHPDVCFAAGALSPVPKGVGAMTISALLINASISAQSDEYTPRK